MSTDNEIRKKTKEELLVRAAELLDIISAKFNTDSASIVLVTAMDRSIVEESVEVSKRIKAFDE